MIGVNMKKHLVTSLFLALMVVTTGFNCIIDPNSDNPPSQPNEKPYLGGQVRSVVPYKYGKFMVRMKPIIRSGVISSFFTYDRPETKEEIDIEFVGVNNREVQFNYHHPSEGFNIPGVNCPGRHAYRYHLNFEPGADFHIYSFEWTKDYIAWFVDGIEAHRVTKGLLDPLDELAHEQSIMMNIWTSTNIGWSGNLDPNALPFSVAYDWVKYYPWHESTGFDTNPSFQDYFDNLNLSIWFPCEETFDANNAKFVPMNDIVRNGYLFLYLTKRGTCNVIDVPPCDSVPQYFALSTVLYGKQANGSEGEISCYSDVFPEHGIRISPWDGSGRAIYNFGPVSHDHVNVSFQWEDNGWWSDLKTLDIWNWNTCAWQQVASWNGNDGTVHNDTYGIDITADRKGPSNQIRISLYGAPNSVIHLNTITAY
jgi:hypothetical protein